jgi:hypothetical protein
MRWVRGDFIGLTTLIAYAILVQQLGLAVAQRLPREQESPSRVTKVRLMSLRKALQMHDGTMHAANAFWLKLRTSIIAWLVMQLRT